MVKFFHIIYKKVLLTLLASRYCDEGLLRLVSMYFDIIEINGHGILYLYYLVLLKRASYLLTLHAKI